MKILLRNTFLRYIIISFTTFILSVSSYAAEVSIMATWGGDEEAGYRELLNGFTAKTGIDYIYEGDRDVQETVKQRLAGGNPPDVAILPRPGEMVALIKAGALIPLDEMLDQDYIDANYGAGMVGLGSYEGKFYGLPNAPNSKSTVWYKPQSFKDLGVEIPDTWDELMAITEKYKAAGQTPWAMGGRDGWTLTDWFENIYIRVAGPEKYQQLFVTHEIEWTDSSVLEAMEYVKQFYSADNLLGGPEGALATGFIEAMDDVVQGKAEMYYLAGFMKGIAEENNPDKKCGKDFATFEFPSIKPEYGKPVVIGGDFAVAFNKDPETVAFMNYLASEKASTDWASAPVGAIISPNKNVPLSVYDECIGKEAAQIGGATIAVFDGSDLATPAVGGDAMFVGLQDIVADPDSLMDILEFIEDAADNSY